MNDFFLSFAAIISGGVIGISLCIPAQIGLNALAKKICQGDESRVLVAYKDPIFLGNKVACIKKEYKD